MAAAARGHALEAWPWDTNDRAKRTTALALSERVGPIQSFGRGTHMTFLALLADLFSSALIIGTTHSWS